MLATHLPSQSPLSAHNFRPKPRSAAHPSPRRYCRRRSRQQRTLARFAKMNFSKVNVLLGAMMGLGGAAVLPTSLATDAEAGLSSQLRRRKAQQGESGWRPMRAECLYVLLVKDNADGIDASYDECILGAEDGGTTVRLPDHIVNKIKKRTAIRSGKSKVFIPGAKIGESGNVLLAPPDADPLVGNGEARGRRDLAVVTGNKSVLVVRVVAANGSTGFTEAELSDSVFGNAGDPVNLKSQYAQCSLDQLNFVMAADRTGASTAISNGAVTVTVAKSTTEGDAVMRNAITTELNAQFGVSSPSALANHVMYCLPAGTMSGIAYAYVDSWNSVYSNEWCTYVSGQMHEIGHNLNLGHANEAGAYNDQSGMMGYSYANDDSPRMCFNAAKTFQLGWYSNRHHVFNPADGLWQGDLVGVAEYANSTTETVVLKINNPSSATDYYVNFNRKVGFNSGTQEGGNQVTVVEQGAEGTGYAESELRAKLIAGGTYYIAAVDTYVRVRSISTSGVPGRANVCVSVGRDCDAIAAPVTSPTPAPVMPAPIMPPTASPIKAPTKSPTKAPTASPIKAPTKSPIKAPTASPIQAPTKSPTKAPTKAPVPCSLAPKGATCRKSSDCCSGLCSGGKKKICA